MSDSAPSGSSHVGPDLGVCLRRVERCIRFGRALRMEHDTGQSDLMPAFLDAVALFESLDIRYALVGGVAAMHYGRSRHTEDVDFVAASGHADVLEANPDVMADHHFAPDCSWKLYHDSGTAIDLWKDRHSDAIVARALTAHLAGRDVRVADPHDLIAMKLRADRPQDDYDVAEVAAHNRIDDDRIGRLVTPEEYDRYLAIKRRSSRPAPPSPRAGEPAD